ncbi:MAG TPA: PaaI family thioesterase [Candidatus Dormibacteraeota bacterium]|nr:PaaI family thioesterase [Candidatus Dormibacteraeota bacterium]
MSKDFAARLNETPEGWLQAMGVTITLATRDEVRCELAVGTAHLQGYGIVHGGVHCGLIESLASIGAYLFAQEKGQHVVGLENNTSFIRAVRAGTSLHAVAKPITRGRRTQVWEAQVLDEQERIVATGRVRLLCLEPDQALAGEQVQGVLHSDRK